MNDATLFPDDPTAAPLAERMRPADLDQVVGQTALVGEGGVIRVLLRDGDLPSMGVFGADREWQDHHRPAVGRRRRCGRW